MKLEPLFARVLVRADALEDQARYAAAKRAGLVLPETLKDKDVPDMGTVVAVGPTAEGVKVGDRVVWGKWAAKKLPWDADLWVMQDEDVIGIIRDKGRAAA